MAYDKLRSFGAVDGEFRSSRGNVVGGRGIKSIIEILQRLANLSGMDAAISMKWSPGTIGKVTASTIAGCLLGILCSVIVNCTLIEISLSTFFATYFGLLFVSVGLIILWRLRVRTNEDEESAKNTTTLSAFAGLIIASGLLCFFLERSWLLAWPTVLRVPLYSLIGVAVSFALTFALVDLLNFSCGICQTSASMSIVETPQQVRLVLVTATAMGSIFGFIFGIMDVNDAVAFHIRLALLTEERHCLPIGAIFGGLAGFGNETLRIHARQTAKRRQGSLDDEI